MVTLLQVYKGLDFRRNMEVVNKTGYSSEMYSEEARKIIEAHNASEVNLAVTSKKGELLNIRYATAQGQIRQRLRAV